LADITFEDEKFKSNTLKNKKGPFKSSDDKDTFEIKMEVVKQDSLSRGHLSVRDQISSN
jgi:hypothetical protein